ncbi:hypothetical protein [Leifsonia sp. A12D58]|uniref:hypothetical protein n=1 Tax=Leifsonia sp. A12D58 TaxID=3397674 RepID=UPI0039E0DA15
MPGIGLLPPTVPWQLVVGCAIGATVLSLATSVLPARRATTLSPMVALAAD